MSRESNNQPEASSNTFQSGGGTQSVAQGDKAIGTQINNYYAPPPQESKPQPAPSVKTEIPTVVVDVWHRGDYATITDALKAVKAGTRILVRPGVYEEGIVLDKPVEIIGDGNRDDIVIEASSKHTVIFQATIGRLANLTLRQAGGNHWFCVDITNGRLALEDCDISSQSLIFNCVSIHDRANPRVRRNRIMGSSGVHVYNDGQGMLEDNEITANAGAGVAISTGGNPTLRRNRIYYGQGTGVLVGENGQGTLEDNEIFANAGTGVLIMAGGNPTLRRNRITQNGNIGISMHSGGGGIFEDNDLRGNTNGAWSIEPDCEARMQRRGNLE